MQQFRGDEHRSRHDDQGESRTALHLGAHDHGQIQRRRQSLHRHGGPAQIRRLRPGGPDGRTVQQHRPREFHTLRRLPEPRRHGVVRVEKRSLRGCAVPRRRALRQSLHPLPPDNGDGRHPLLAGRKGHVGRHHESQVRPAGAGVRHGARLPADGLPRISRRVRPTSRATSSSAATPRNGSRRPTPCG